MGDSKDSKANRSERSECVKVCVRVRPMNAVETERGSKGCLSYVHALWHFLLLTCYGLRLEIVPL